MKADHRHNRHTAGKAVLCFILMAVLCIAAVFGSFGEEVSGQPAVSAAGPSFDVECIKVPDTARVLIVVEANGEAVNTTGKIYAYTRQLGPTGASSWEGFLSGEEALLGKGGMGKTKEGDKKTPVGMFTMDTPFGIGEKKTGFPDNYLQVKDQHYWVGDCASSMYNRLVDITQVASFSTADSEHLIEVSPAYQYALNIGYNSECKSGAGSALFLHCFKADHSNSSGCIAISERNMTAILKAYEEKETVILIDTKGCFEKYYKTQAATVTTETATSEAQTTDTKAQTVQSTAQAATTISQEAQTIQTAQTTQSVTLNPNWRFAELSKIRSGSATLYRAANNRKNIVIGVNAGHGTSGGSSVKTWCHPDKTAKVTGGTTAAGSTKAVAVSSGMTFSDGTAESTVTLKEAQILKELLLEKGYDVLMIRDGEDVQLDNVARTVICNNMADCHIAIHWDGDGLSYDKGCFYMSVPDGIKYLDNVAATWEKSEALGASLIKGLESRGQKIFSGGSMDMDLTQTSYSSVPSVDIELGNQSSDHSEEKLRSLAEGLLAGIELYYSK